MNRRKSREYAIKFLYEMMINKCDYNEVIETYKENNEKKSEENMEYVKELVEGTEANKEKLDENIQKHMIKWSINRLSKINKIILRVATYEILFKEDIPNVVSVNEAVDLAKKYSDYKSASFINGVLDSMIK